MYRIESLGELNSSISDEGVVEKWYDEKNKLYIKTSRYLKGSRVYGTEAVMECVAYEIGKLLNVNVVPYRLDSITKKNNKNVLVCVSQDYRSLVGATARVSARKFLSKLGKLSLNSRSDRYYSLINKYPHLRLELDKMIVFDYLIDNTDRHLNNFEFYTRGNDVYLSPLFDNGSSLLSDWYREDDLADLKSSKELFDDHIRYAETQSKCFAHQHSSELSLVDRSVFSHINMLIEVKEFDSILSKYSNYLSPLRVELISMLLKTRYNNIVSRCI